MGSYPALDLTYESGLAVPALQELVHATLDRFEPVAIHELASSGAWRIFFSGCRQRDDAAAALSKLLGARLIAIEPVEVPDDDWARRSQATLKAVRIGRIIVAPPWDLPADSTRYLDETLIVIDPSTGFGTGHHATTRLCLELLQETPLKGARVIDLGTGSGVLAIAALKLGASCVLAIDNDADALQNAHENIARNDASAGILLRQADLASLTVDEAETVVANLTAAAIQKHAATIRRLVVSGGNLILSGFNPADTARVARAFGAEPERELHDENWAAVVLRP